MLYDKLTIATERVTPKMAEEWLSDNHRNNRKINRERVNSYMHDMMSGNWSNNAEAIKFDKNGILVDGQHRLTALKESGKSIWMTIARGVDDNAFMTIDVGMNRTARQIIKMGGGDGIMQKKNIVGATNILLKCYTDVRIPTQSMIQECIESNRDLYEWFYDTLPNSGNIPSQYEALAIVANVHGVPESEIVGFIRGAYASDFDSAKNTNAFKYCVQIETWRKSGGRCGHYKTVMETMKRYFYSYVHEYGKLTSKDDLYPCSMKSNYRLIPTVVPGR
jgi:hypothetical protein